MKLFLPFFTYFLVVSFGWATPNEVCEKLIINGATSDLVAADDAFTGGLRSAPVATYLELRERALANAEDDFPFAPHRTIIQRVVEDLSFRLNTIAGQKHRQLLEQTRTRANELLEKGDPLYKATVRFMFSEYFSVLRTLLLERYPQLATTTYHRHNAEHLIEPLLAKAPDLFLYFSFRWQDEEFFTDTRSAPMNLIGIDLAGLDETEPINDIKDRLRSREKGDPPYGDGFFMPTDEFSYHDLGHAEYTSMRDLEFLEAGEHPLIRIVWEWESTRRRIKSVVAQVEGKDHVLAEAMRTVLFELLRERGFQYSLTVLKQELETSKWTDVLRKKLLSGFYDHHGTNRAKFERLEEARSLLVKAVERFKEEDQISWIRAIKAQIVPAKIRHTPALLYRSGRLEEIVIRAEGPIQVQFSTENEKAIQTEIREVVGVQVNPVKESPFHEGIRDKIEQLLSHSAVFAIVIKKDKSIFVRFSDGRESPIEKVEPGPGKIVRHLENLEVFKMEQILGTFERGEQSVMTLRQPVETLIGMIELEQDLITGRHTARVNQISGATREFPLVELRVDPL